MQFRYAKVALYACLDLWIFTNDFLLLTMHLTVVNPLCADCTLQLEALETICASCTWQLGNDMRILHMTSFSSLDALHNFC